MHAAVVIGTLVWLPFGKFFHIFQRPAQLGVAFYKDAGKRGEQARCARCGECYASQMHVDDLIEVERQLGYQYETTSESDRALSAYLSSLPPTSARVSAGPPVAHGG